MSGKDLAGITLVIKTMPLQAGLWFSSCVYSKRIFCASLTVSLSVCLFYFMVGRCGSSCWVWGARAAPCWQVVGQAASLSKISCAALALLFPPLSFFISSNRSLESLKHTSAITQLVTNRAEMWLQIQAPKLLTEKERTKCPHTKIRVLCISLYKVCWCPWICGWVLMLCPVWWSSYPNSQTRKVRPRKVWCAGLPS